MQIRIHSQIRIMTVEKILLEFKTEEKNILPALQKINKAFGKVGKKDARKVADYFSVPLSRIYETASFYDRINTENQPPVVIQVCFSTHCALSGSGEIIAEIERQLGIKVGDENSSHFKLEKISCIGRCGEGPVVLVNGKIYERANVGKVKEILKEYL